MTYTDRSRTELDFVCTRARYWQFEHEGKGLVPLETPQELAFGGSMAEELAHIKLGKAWTTEAFSGEMKLVAEALLLGYQLYVWPKWLKEYDVVGIEQECPKLLTPNLTYNSRPDTISRRKSDKTLWYGPEDKTTGWVQSLLGYTNNVQLQATALCIEDNLKEPVAGCLVQGLYKGFKKEGKYYHPLVYAYSKEGIPGITPDQWTLKWTRGWERRPTTEFPGGIEGWIRHLMTKQPDVLAEAFPVSPEVMIRRDLAQVYLEQIVRREEALQSWRNRGEQHLYLELFPQNFSMCLEFGRSRKPCSYHPLCWNPTARRFPMTFYKERTPHHPEGVLKA